MGNKSLNIHIDSFTKSSALHEHLLEALPLLIFVVNKNDRIIYEDKKFRSIANLNHADENISMKEIVNRNDWNSWNENLFQLSNLCDDKTAVFNIRFNIEKSIKYFKLEGKVFERDECNKPSLYFFIANDVTQQFKTENFTADENVSSYDWKNFISKTSEEQQLERTVKELGKSNKDLEEFAYIASHDLQEPLRKVSSLISRLDHKFSNQLGAEGKIFIDKINTAAYGMKQIIDNLLQISRTVQSTKTFTETDLNHILDQVQQNLDLKISEEQVEIFHDHLPVIDALPTLIIQLFSNILSNAIKFSSVGQKAIIRITSKEVSEAEKNPLSLSSENKYYKIKIKDNGIGFKPDFAEDIFKIFYRLNAKTEYPGTGIGLAICKKIVEKHNGFIWAESEPGKGAPFNIILPKKQR